MKKTALILFCIGMAQAQPTTDLELTSKLLNEYGDQLSNVLATKPLPAGYISCLSGSSLGVSVPEKLKLRACGIAKDGQKIFMNIQSENGLSIISTMPDSHFSTPKNRAIDDMKAAIRIYEMRLTLHQPLPQSC
uniref:hypothetical protein n=1 Tax=Deinococcus sp. TaxID=47478 RepID=UPI0025BDF02A